MSDNPLRIETPRVRGLVYPTAALFAEVRFRLPSGHWVEPFAKAPWGDARDPDIPGHMRRLGGEFFCLPFGGGGATRDPKPGWERLAEGPVDLPMHGPAANEDWQVIDRRDDRATLALDFPREFAVRRIERTIALSAKEPRVEIGIRIMARRTGCVPAAFHPILRLPDTPGELEIDADFALGLTYPGVIDPDRMASEPGQQFSNLSDVPRRRGGRIDLRRLPLGPPAEDVVLMAGVWGPVRARFLSEGFALDIDWNRNLLPHCMMWLHDRGIDARPWSGRYRGLGIEPMAAAFDGPWSLSSGLNPLNAIGYATALHLEPDSATKLECTYTVSAL